MPVKITCRSCAEEIFQGAPDHKTLGELRSLDQCSDCILQEERSKCSKHLAEALHVLLCRGNHTDGCDWHYGSWTQPSYAHQKYLRKAEALQEKLRDLDIDPVDFVDALSDLTK